jgi:hypothetical protein
MEALHSAITQFCFNGSTIDKLAREMDQMTNQQRIKSESEALDFVFGALLGPSPVLSPAAVKIGGNRGYCSRLLFNNAQACQLVIYCLEIDKSEESNVVSTEEWPFVFSRLSDHSNVGLAWTLEDEVRRHL